jgi:hypothetical protein
MYKRNQVELALSNWLEPGVHGPSQALKTRIKRLLETDRALGHMPRSSNPEKANFAFFRSAGPGSGNEVQFSSYESFALLLALQLMSHKWPQRFAVSALRRVRPELEKEHHRILKQDPSKLFDQAAIGRMRKPGSAAYDTTAPVLLVIVSRHGLTADQEEGPFACSVQPEGSAWDWVQKTTAGVGGGATLFELTVAAHQLNTALERTKPQSRGRSS